MALNFDASFKKPWLFIGVANGEGLLGIALPVKVPQALFAHSAMPGTLAKCWLPNTPSLG